MPDIHTTIQSFTSVGEIESYITVIKGTLLCGRMRRSDCSSRNPKLRDLFVVFRARKFHPFCQRHIMEECPDGDKDYLPANEAVHLLEERKQELQKQERLAEQKRIQEAERAERKRKEAQAGETFLSNGNGNWRQHWSDEAVESFLLHWDKELACFMAEQGGCTEPKASCVLIIPVEDGQQIHEIKPSCSGHAELCQLIEQARAFSPISGVYLALVYEKQRRIEELQKKQERARLRLHEFVKKYLEDRLKPHSDEDVEYRLRSLTVEQVAVLQAQADKANRNE